MGLFDALKPVITTPDYSAPTIAPTSNQDDTIDDSVDNNTYDAHLAGETGDADEVGTFANQNSADAAESFANNALSGGDNIIEERVLQGVARDVQVNNGASAQDYYNAYVAKFAEKAANGDVVSVKDKDGNEQNFIVREVVTNNQRSWQLTLVDPKKNKQKMQDDSVATKVKTSEEADQTIADGVKAQSELKASSTKAADNFNVSYDAQNGNLQIKDSNNNPLVTVDSSTGQPAFVTPPSSEQVTGVVMKIAQSGGSGLSDDGAAIYARDIAEKYKDNPNGALQQAYRDFKYNNATPQAQAGAAGPDGKPAAGGAYADSKGEGKEAGDPYASYRDPAAYLKSKDKSDATNNRDGNKASKTDDIIAQAELIYGKDHPEKLWAIVAGTNADGSPRTVSDVGALVDNASQGMISSKQVDALGATLSSGGKDSKAGDTDAGKARATEIAQAANQHIGALRDQVAEKQAKIDDLTQQIKDRAQDVTNGKDRETNLAAIADLKQQKLKLEGEAYQLRQEMASLPRKYDDIKYKGSEIADVTGGALKASKAECQLADARALADKVMGDNALNNAQILGDRVAATVESTVKSAKTLTETVGSVMSTAKNVTDFATRDRKDLEQMAEKNNERTDKLSQRTDQHSQRVQDAGNKAMSEAANRYNQSAQQARQNIAQQSQAPLQAMLQPKKKDNDMYKQQKAQQEQAEAQLAESKRKGAQLQQA